MPALKVFYFAAGFRQDQKLLRELERHLSGQRKLIDAAHPGQVQPGANRKDAILGLLREAQVVMPLLSADLLADGDEVLAACLSESMIQAGTGQVRVVPVLLRHCDFEAAGWQRAHVMPRDGKPVGARFYRDKVWNEVVRGLRDGSAHAEPADAVAEPAWWRRTPRFVPLAGSAVLGGAITLWAETGVPADMVKLPGATFTLQMPFEDAQPVAPFLLDRTEVTRADYLRWLRARTGVRMEGKLVKDADGVLLVDLGAAGFSLEDQSRLPVSGVTQVGAARYCEARHKRLPRYKEWDLAAAGVDRLRDHPWGAGPPGCNGVVYGRDPTRGGDHGACAATGAGPTEVGSAAQDVTAENVRDLAGNVSEWVDSGKGRFFARGGSWDKGEGACQARYFTRLEASVGYDDVGVRCAKDLSWLTRIFR